MNDLISRKAAIDALGEEPPIWYDGDDEIAERNQWLRDVKAIRNLPSAEQTAAKSAKVDGDLINRQDAITVCNSAIDLWEGQLGVGALVAVRDKIAELTIKPERKNGKWTTEEVAEILFNAFGDDCACNFNGIDEWLPERCKYTQIADECPNPKEKHGCWVQFLLQGGANMRDNSDECFNQQTASNKGDV